MTQIPNEPGGLDLDAPSEQEVIENELLASMDPAQQSLAEALRITFRGLVIVMVLLAALFVGSGFQTVNETERGVKLVFGRVINANVSPGYTFSAPFPIGEIVRVPIGEQRLELRDSFGPGIPSERMVRDITISDVATSNLSLRVQEDGYVVTGDGSLAQTWWSVTWRREDPFRTLQALADGEEERIVRSAVERGIVRAAAETTIDGVLKQTEAASGVAQSGLALRVREIAQRTLDDIESGIRIDRVVLDDKTPPKRTETSFAAVTTAESLASRTREEAQREAQQILQGAAGPVYQTMLALIDEYEAALELEDADAADDVMARVDAILDGSGVEVRGETVTVAGTAKSIIDSAREYRTNVVASARSRAREFEVMREKYLASPVTFVASLWRPAYDRFRENNAVEAFALPPDTDLSIWLNSDPAIREAEQVEQYTAEAEGAVDQRERDQRRARRERDRQRDLEDAGGSPR